MNRIVPALEWLALLPLWRRVFGPKAFQFLFAGATATLWVVIIAAALPDGDGKEPADGASAARAAPGAVAEADDVRVVLHEIADPWSSETQFQQPPEGRRLVAFDVTIDFFGDKGTLVANPFHFKLTDSANFAYAEILRGPEPMLNTVDLGSGQKTRGWIAFEVELNTPLKTLEYNAGRSMTNGIEFFFQ